MARSTKKLTAAQIAGLNLVAKRDWPAGEPRIGWMNCATANVLRRHGLIEEREGTAVIGEFRSQSPIVDLTDAGRAALADAAAKP